MYNNILNSHSAWQRFKVNNGIRISKNNGVSEYILQSKIIKYVNEYIKKTDFKLFCTYKSSDDLIDVMTNRIMRLDLSDLEEFDKILSNEMKDACIFLKIKQPNK